MAEQWMSIVEYARNFAISDMTVRRRIKNGKLNAVLRDGKYYIQINSNQASTASPTKDTAYPSTIASSPSPTDMTQRGAILSPRGWHQDHPKSFDPSKTLAREDSTSPSEIKALVDYCNRSLNRLASIERHLNETYQSKLARLEAELRSKDMELVQLKQRVEDLQILIKMYDSSGRKA